MFSEECGESQDHPELRAMLSGFPGAFQGLSELQREDPAAAAPQPAGVLHEALAAVVVDMQQQQQRQEQGMVQLHLQLNNLQQREQLQERRAPQTG